MRPSIDPNRARPRVVHVATIDWSLAVQVIDHLRAMRDAGYEVIGVSSDGPLVARLEAEGIAHVPMQHSTRSVDVVRDVGALLELVGIIRRLRPDIVHTHNPKPSFYGRIAARLTGVPVVVNTTAGLYAQVTDTDRKRRAVYTMERIASLCSDAELVQSREDVEVMRRIGVSDRKLVHLGNGIHLDRFDPARIDQEQVARLRGTLGAGPDDVVAAYVGRIRREKGIADFVDAASALRQRYPQLRFVAVGPVDRARDGISRGALERATARSGVTFLGVHEATEVVYAASDIYVHPSHREGVPRAPMEAAAMGVPVVATDIRGCREVVDDGVTGVLVPVSDTRALSAAIARLVDDAELRAKMGAAGIERAHEAFDLTHVLSRELAVYSRLLARHGIASPSAGHR